MATAAIRGARKTTQLLLAFLSLLGLVVLLGSAFERFNVAAWFPAAAPPSAALAANVPSQRVEALGRLEPEGGIINLGVSAPMGDRLRSLFVKEGDEVAKDQELARLESYGDRQIECDLAVSQLNEARDRLAAITAHGTCQIEEARIRLRQIEEIEPLDIPAQTKKVALLSDQLARAEQNWQRLQELKQDTLSRQEMEQQELLVKQARVDLSSAQALLEKTKKGHELNRLSAQAQLRTLETGLVRYQQELPIRSLEKAVQVAQDRWRHTSIRAPSAGRILKCLAHAGETVGSQPILRMADLSQMLALAEVYETDVRRVHIGQRATVRSPALPVAELSGKVVHVGRLIDRNYIYDLDPRADADRRIVPVKIRLDQSEPAAHFVNLQVTVSVEVIADGQP